METFITGTGQTVSVHNKEDCSGNCPIHNPSDHHMVDWPLNWRQDLGIFERLCKHGIGHPDPDSLKYVNELWKKTYGEDADSGLGIHGCDGCCNKDSKINK